MTAMADLNSHQLSHQYSKFREQHGMKIDIIPMVMGLPSFVYIAGTHAFTFHHMSLYCCFDYIRKTDNANNIDWYDTACH